MNGRQSAFPVVGMSQHGTQPITAVFQPGMDLRDYFAAKAMQGFCTHHPTDITPETVNKEATIAYRIADAMMAARNNNKE